MTHLLCLLMNAFTIHVFQGGYIKSNLIPLMGGVAEAQRDHKAALQVERLSVDAVKRRRRGPTDIVQGQGTAKGDVLFQTRVEQSRDVCETQGHHGVGTRTANIRARFAIGESPPWDFDLQLGEAYELQIETVM